MKKNRGRKGSRTRPTQGQGRADAMVQHQPLSASIPREVTSSAWHHAPVVRNAGRRIKKIAAVCAGIAAVSASVVAVFGVWKIVEQQITGPEIQADTQQTQEHHFGIRFSLRNPTMFIPMDQMSFTCALDRVVMKTGFQFLNMKLTQSGVVADIAPQQTVHYRCPFDTFIGGFGDVTTARITIQVAYRSLWLQRADTSSEFNWDDQSKTWLRGRTVN